MVVSENLRLFLSIPLPEPVKNAVEAAQNELRQGLRNAKVRWAIREQFHLTLKFLGAIPSPVLGDLQKALLAPGARFAPLDLRAKGIGFFPGARSPRVIWAGIEDGRGALVPLQRAIEGAVAPFTSEQPEKRFSGHVTLGRVREIPRAEAEQLASIASSMASRSFGDWIAGEFLLMRSMLSSRGATHTPVISVSLNGTN